MIKNINGQHHLEFGAGDIRISSGYTTEFSKEKRALVIFENQNPPQPIGKNPNSKERECFCISNLDIPVFMTFSKVESIDALIEALENAKYELMK